MQLADIEFERSGSGRRICERLGRTTAASPRLANNDANGSADSPSWRPQVSSSVRRKESSLTRLLLKRLLKDGAPGKSLARFVELHLPLLTEQA